MEGRDGGPVMTCEAAQRHFAHGLCANCAAGAGAAAGRWGSLICSPPSIPAPKPEPRRTDQPRSGALQVGTDRTIPETPIHCSGASCARAFSCPGPSPAGMWRSKQRSTAFRRRKIWAAYQAVRHATRRVGRPAPELSSQRLWWRASTGWMEPGLVRSGPARAGGGAQRSGASSDPAPRQTPPCNCLAGGIAQRAGAGAGPSRSEACLELLERHRGSARATSGAALLPRTSPAGERHTQANCAPGPRATGNRQPAGGDQGPIVPERRSSGACRRCLMVPCQTGQRERGGACCRLPPLLGWSARNGSPRHGPEAWSAASGGPVKRHRPHRGCWAIGGN